MISVNPKDQFRTPQSLFNRYNSRFGFTIDGAASAHDTLCDRWWGPGGEVEDFFHTTQGRWVSERVWINPPYSMIPQFLAHAKATMFGTHAESVWLLPVWTDRKWWHDYIWNQTCPQPRVTVEFLPGRVKFLAPDGSPPVGVNGKPQSGTFASCVVTML